MAIRRRRPPAGVIHHADHGSQYTSLLSCDRAYGEQVRLSFGRIGTVADNAAIEAFWSTLKRELRFLYRRRVWPDRASLRAALFDYLEIFFRRPANVRASSSSRSKSAVPWKIELAPVCPVITGESVTWTRSTNPAAISARFIDRLPWERNGISAGESHETHHPPEASPPLPLPMAPG